MNGFVQQILHASTWAVLGIVGLVVFAEDALFVGFVLPGETAAVLGGVAAKLGHVPLWAVLVTVVVAAVLGDTVGYEVGKHLGPRLLELRILRGRRERLDQARDLLARRGGVAVLLGRWVAFFRAVMPALAGTVKMPYPRFLLFNATGGIVWGTVVVLVGYAAGASYSSVERSLGRGTAVVVAVLVVAGVLVWRLGRHRRARAHRGGGDEAAPHALGGTAD